MAVNNRIFISFAVEDAKFRDMLKGQASNASSPFDFVDMSVKEPWDNNWKTRCRTKIKGCDGMIAMLSKRTRDAGGARWEINCAVEEKIPVIGVHIHKNDKGAVPSELDNNRVIEWTWDGIKRFIDSL